MPFQASNRKVHLARDMTIRFPAAQAGLWVEFVRGAGLVHPETGAPRAGEAARVIFTGLLLPGQPVRFQAAVALHRNAVLLLSGLLAQSTSRLQGALLTLLGRDFPLTPSERVAFADVAQSRGGHGGRKSRAESLGPDPARVHIALDGWLFDGLTSYLASRGQVDHAAQGLREILLAATHRAEARKLLQTYGRAAATLRTALERAIDRAVDGLADEIQSL